jgi:hypothetical protein
MHGNSEESKNNAINQAQRDKLSNIHKNLGEWKNDEDRGYGNRLRQMQEPSEECGEGGSRVWR